MSNNDEKPNLPIKRKRGRPKSSGKLSTSEIDVPIKTEEEQTRTRSSRKRNSTIEEENNNEDETSMDDISLAIRRSSRFQKPSTIQPISKTISSV